MDSGLTDVANKLGTPSRTASKGYRGKMDI